MSYRFSGITDQRKASLRRKDDARALRASNRWRGAMYMLGYAVECSLKARLMERYRTRHLSGLERELSRRLGRTIDLRTHSLSELLEFTQSEHRLTGPVQRAYNRCRAWTVDWRYDPRSGTEGECRDFFDNCDRFLGFVATSV